MPAPDLDRARARVGSYRNTMLVVRTADAVLPADRVRAAVRAGLQAPADGQKVTYDLEKGRDGRESAINVRFA